MESGPLLFELDPSYHLCLFAMTSDEMIRFMTLSFVTSCSISRLETWRIWLSARMLYTTCMNVHLSRIDRMLSSKRCCIELSVMLLVLTKPVSMDVYGYLYAYSCKQLSTILTSHHDVLTSIPYFL